MALVGLVDTSVSVENASWNVNKIGGKPDWMYPVNETMKCERCSNEMLFVCQIYCPVGDSPFHRTLYIFCCVQPGCQSRQECFRVVRMQLLATVPQKREETWSAVGDKWLDEADDWGDEGSTHSDAVSSETKRDIYDAPHGVICPNADTMQRDMCSLDIDSEEEEDEEEAPTLSVGVPDDERKSFLQSLESQSEMSSEVKQVEFMSYYVNALDENDFEIPKVSRKMLQQNRCDDEVRNDDDGSVSGEKFEKSIPSHGDVLFHKFSKKIERCPSQCLRYEWQGMPLHTHRAGLNVAVPACAQCGARRVFEMQLMPAMINYLTLSNQQQNVVEFGTVLLFSCEALCWNEGETKCRRYEFCIVESDPDHELFVQR